MLTHAFACKFPVNGVVTWHYSGNKSNIRLEWTHVWRHYLGLLWCYVINTAITKQEMNNQCAAITPWCHFDVVFSVPFKWFKLCFNFRNCSVESCEMWIYYYNDMGPLWLCNCVNQNDRRIDNNWVGKYIRVRNIMVFDATRRPRTTTALKRVVHCSYFCCCLVYLVRTD